MKDRGFSLLEVLISIIILSSFVISVFYFYSGAIGNQRSLNEKYRLLRICREFINNFQETENQGREKKDRFLLEWEAFPIEASRKVTRTGGEINSFLQLKLVHLDILRKSDKKKVISLNFIYNAFIPVKQ